MTLQITAPGQLADYLLAQEAAYLERDLAELDEHLADALDVRESIETELHALRRERTALRELLA